jgi:O-antigen/teichoic acid export membrane protein
VHPNLMQQRLAPAQASSRLDTPMRRLARNISWLVFAEGLTRASTPVANILLARFLASTGYGVLALAQTWATFASMAADLGVNVYGQAEAARASEAGDLVRLAEEIIPFRMVAGLLTFAAFAVVVWCANPSDSRSVFLAAGLYIPAIALGVDWLIRGLERFDLVLLANGAGAAFLLLTIVVIGSRRNALLLDVLSWALSWCVMVAVYLSFLRKVIGAPLRLRFEPARWMVHLRPLSLLLLSGVLLNGYYFLPLVLLGWFRSSREVGIFAAPYRLVINLQNILLLLPSAFYPVGAALFRKSAQQFHQSRRSMAQLMLMAGLPVTIVGGAMAGPAMRLIFGRDFAASGPVFALVVWLLPLYVIRSIHGTTIVSTGFYRVQVLAPVAGVVITLISGVWLVPLWGPIGAGVSQLAGEIGMVVANLLISLAVHGEVGIPPLPELAKLLLLNLLLAAATLYFPDRLGWVAFAVIAMSCYSAGLLLLGLINLSAVMAWVLPAPGRLAE